ncbi:MAG: hypothetical protein HKO92_05855 [Flavobacteriaceae bacterium]|nr:hypothetical protein [Flavobacteriaceae bacterium]
MFFPLLLISCNSSEDIEIDNSIVVIKFKAKPNKGLEATSELINLIEMVKHEPHFVNIKLHIDPNDETNIMLYEEWDDISYYKNEHMTTDHLKEFQLNSVNFLNGPPEISFWNIKKIFDKEK